MKRHRGRNILAGWAAAYAGAVSSILVLAGCGNDAADAQATDNAAEITGATNRIDVPPMVRRNLGITFAQVQRRPVRTTVRVPGEFELTPEAVREYHSMLSGRIELLVRQYETVDARQTLVVLDSPEWRDLQGELSKAAAAAELAESAMHVAEATLQETQSAIDFTQQRISSLAEAQVRKVDLEAQLAEMKNKVPRLKAEVGSREKTLEAARAHYDVLLRRAAAITGLPVAELQEPVEHHATAGHEPRGWHAIDQLQMKAKIAGIVDELAVTNGGWVETGGLILTTVDPTGVRFRASALQSDMPRFENGLPVRIVPPQVGSVDPHSAIDATLRVGFRGDPEDRTIPLFAVPGQQSLPRWVRPGVGGYLEVFVEGTEQPELAIPESALVRDGLDLVIFRRLPDNPNAVMRIDADLGISDGRWVVVNSGVKEGDEIVLEGAYELMLATAGQQAAGGHFHADGTFHEEH